MSKHDLVERVAQHVVNDQEWRMDFTSVEDYLEYRDRSGGWTFETSAPLGGFIRHENVVLGPACRSKVLERVNEIANVAHT